MAITCKLLPVKVIAVLLIAGVCSATHHWSYEGEYGPQHWHKLFPDGCSGSMQSPININPEETMYDPNLKEFAIWYDPPKPNSKMIVKNNGHSIQVDTVGDFFVTNGGLGFVYKTVQFHFHWGHSDYQGSEHFIEGKQYPLEMHVVNYNHDLYNDVAQAVTEPMGLAVLGILFEIGDKDNEALTPILNAIRHVRNPEKQDKFEIPAVSIRNLLPDDISRYYRYNGSLTTPGCFESVVWTIFEQKATISLNQVLEFRRVLKPKRFYSHKKGQHKKKPHRASRSKAEANAEVVLEELGIQGDPVQKTELKSMMMEKKLNEKMAAAVAEKTTTTPVLDEQMAKQAENHMMKQLKDEKKHRELGAYNIQNVEITEDIQENLVNNFRPLQPRNNRIIYRSFKLGTQAPVQVVGFAKGSAAVVSSSFCTLLAALAHTLHQFW